MNTNFTHYTKSFTNFWGGNLEGWAPKEAINSINEFNFDSATSIAEYLDSIEVYNLIEGEQILVWAALGALLEWYLKILIAVYIRDYNNKPMISQRTKTKIKPEKLNFELVKQLIVREKLFNSKLVSTISLVHQSRNMIHLNLKKTIPSITELNESINNVYSMVKDIHARVPWPNEIYMQY